MPCLISFHGLFPSVHGYLVSVLFLKQFYFHYLSTRNQQKQKFIFLPSTYHTISQKLILKLDTSVLNSSKLNFDGGGDMIRVQSRTPWFMISLLGINKSRNLFSFCPLIILYLENSF